MMISNGSLSSSLPGAVLDGIQPVRQDNPASAPPDETPSDGIGLCLSGGGYRAMLFHLGSIWRLFDAGALPKVARISSVSGGSITAGVFALAWDTLYPPSGASSSAAASIFDQQVIAPIRRLASKTIDVISVFEGVLLPGSVAGRVAGAYRQELYGDATLQDLPDAVRFVFNATNVQSGALWRFSKPYARDWRVGELANPSFPLATAVAASSAFPPMLSPLELKLNPRAFTPGSGADLQRPPYTTDVLLSDGGVYDNLGVETVWKLYRTVLVSDAGGKMGEDPNAHKDWVRHSIRVLELIDDQVRILRTRQVIDSYVAGLRSGAYWGVRTNIVKYQLADAFACDFGRTTELALTPTRLAALDATYQERLINWGYAVCDAALRKHCADLLRAQYGLRLTRPPQLPYPASGV